VYASERCTTTMRRLFVDGGTPSINQSAAEVDDPVRGSLGPDGFERLPRCRR
jgi:hypothetical protein